MRINIHSLRGPSRDVMVMIINTRCTFIPNLLMDKRMYNTQL